MTIDKNLYYKSIAKKSLSKYGKFMFYTGTGVPYLDYQVWKMYFRWWHPFSFFTIALQFVASVLHGGVGEAIKTIKDLFPSKEDKKFNYFKAFNDISCKQTEIILIDKDNEEIFKGYTFIQNNIEMFKYTKSGCIVKLEEMLNYYNVVK